MTLEDDDGQEREGQSVKVNLPQLALQTFFLETVEQAFFHLVDVPVQFLDVLPERVERVLEVVDQMVAHEIVLRQRR